MVEANHIDDMKRKIRRLKKIEMKIRFGHQHFAGNKKMLQRKTQHDGLIWDHFFGKKQHKKTGTVEGKANTVQDFPHYTVEQLAAMDKSAFQDVIAAFFAHVYYQFYLDNGLSTLFTYDPKLLSQLGLSYDADSQAVKKQFRKLAIQHHPDTGGDVDKFLELMETYENLKEHQH